MVKYISEKNGYIKTGIEYISARLFLIRNNKKQAAKLK